MYIKEEIYKYLESKTKYREDRKKAVEKYNKENNTNFKYAYELMHKLTEEKKTCTEIGNILGLTKDSISKSLKILGVKALPRGGWNVVRDLITYKNVTKPRVEFAKEYNISPNVLRHRLNTYHWSIEKALNTPVRKNKGNK